MIRAHNNGAIAHVHLVSDATGETVNSVARACLAQFEGLEAVEHFWTLVRTKGQVRKVVAGLERDPGPVVYTIVNEDIRAEVEAACRSLGLPAISVLDPIMNMLAGYFGVESRGQPGRQHELDAEYFERIDALNFTLAHDDGHSAGNLDSADVILVGVSRTSKTPTCIYLANRGIKAANVPFVPGCPLPAELMSAKHPLVIGLTKDPARLVQVRRSRLRMLSSDQETDYVNLETVRQEVASARRLFSQHGWTVIDVTRRSVEEIAATILNYLARHQTGEDHEIAR